MNANTEILQIVNLALMINALDGHKVVVDIGGTVAHFCVFIYAKDAVAPIDYLHTFSDQPEAHLKLRVIRQQLESLLEAEEAKAQQLQVAA